MIGAAEAVEADFLESLHVSVTTASSSSNEAVSQQKKATETAAASEDSASSASTVELNKPKNMASSTCSTMSSINSSCWKAESQHACLRSNNSSPSSSPSHQVVQPSSAGAATGTKRTNLAETAVSQVQTTLPPFFITAPVTASSVSSATSVNANIASDAKNDGTGSHAAKAGSNPHRSAKSAGVNAQDVTKRYDTQQLQRCLSDACFDWFDSKSSLAFTSPLHRSPPGYPLNRLKRKRSPSPPCLDSSNADSG